MQRPYSPVHPRALLAVIATAACAAATRPPGPGVVASHAAPVRADSVHHAYTTADTHFMSGMIYHHAQAILMAGWAPTHDASSSVRTLCERIVVAQRDEIALMQRWLRDRQEEAPDASPDMMSGMHQVMMPGMLTGEQLAQLDDARGPEFDRLFLRFMIQHHQGAITMVNQLFGSQGGGEEETVFRFASDVYADQSTEIDRMQKMLVALILQGRGD